MTPSDDVRALTLMQPWASLVMFNEKAYETRSWTTRYRGLLAIHASARMTAPALTLARQVCGRILPLSIDELPLGAILGWTDLLEVLPAETVDVTHREALFGDFGPGRYAWVLGDRRPLTVPAPARGRLGLWIPAL